MGEVYRARDTRLRREVAVKVLPAAFLEDADRLRRFEQEALAASALNHPNILTIHDVGRQAGVPFVVSELLEGETLRERLTAGPLPAGKAIDYGVQIANGLAAAHGKGIVHRDLKPENLFVLKDGRIKILDFGLAKLTHPEGSSTPMGEASTRTAMTEPGLAMGTLAYMSPEQVRGLEVDHRSDIFSLGGVLYEALTGRRAFRGATAADTISAILTAEPDSLSNPEIRSLGRMERVVRRCLEKKPEARFQSARDVAFALGECRSGAGAAPAGSLTRIRPSLVFGAVGVAAGALLLYLALGPGRPGRPPAVPATGSRIESIAVLPLRDLSNAPGEEYFVDGITGALTAELAGIGSLKVISNTSAMQYKGSKKTLREIAQELGVDAVVEGSVARVGNQVKVTTELIGARTDTHLWARSFERELGNILALQDEIAREVARQIEAKLSAQEERRLTQKATIDPRAYEAYLRGRFFLADGTEEGLRQALDQFNRALEFEPRYAPAHAAIGEYYAVLPFYSALSPAEVFPKALAAVTKSLEFDETLPEAHASLAYIRAYYEWDWESADREFRRALELRPSYADAHFSYSRFLAAAGRLEEAISEIERARALDPRSSGLLANRALLLYFGGRYDEALGELRTLLATEPNSPLANWGVGLCYEQKGAADSAVPALEKAATLSKSLNFQVSLAHAYGRFGRAAEARRILKSLEEKSRESYVPSYYFTLILVGLGRDQEALDWLERAYQERSTVLAYLRLDPRLNPLRKDPRFGRLLERLGLPASGSPVVSSARPASR